jgi:hypothetical protein
MPIISLELTSPVALATCHRRAQHLRSAPACSVAVIASMAVCVGVGYVGLLSAILGATILVALCFAATRSRRVQRSLARHAVQRARSRREAARRDALYQATAARRERYLELHGLVADIESSDPVEAQRLELQELLDHFVQLAVGHQRCLESLRVARGNELQAPIPLFENSPTRHRRDIAARRLRHHEEATARLGRIVDEIDSADDFIHLVAQRTACAKLDTLLDGRGELDRRLAELDEVEAALVLISA